MKLAGARGGENVGMSNHKSGESPDRRKPKVSSAMAIIGGLGGPKRKSGFGLAIAMDSRLIFRPFLIFRRSTELSRLGILLDLCLRYKDASLENPRCYL